ncbi:MAG: hypothetical protein RIA62_17820 [Cyclobacteriaceae bacterium]
MTFTHPLYSLYSVACVPQATETLAGTYKHTPSNMILHGLWITIAVNLRGFTQNGVSCKSRRDDRIVE